MSDDVLVRVDNVSKRFCRSLKRSLWYGLQDLGSELGGRRHSSGGGLLHSSADVELRKDEFWAVKDVSFELRRGECLGLLGRNGAGKTTLLRMLNGLIKPDTGNIQMRGYVGALIALGAGFNPILTGRENILISASILGISFKQAAKYIDDIIEFAEIENAIDSPVQSYSSGMQARLGFSAASFMRPDVLLIDEVLAVGDRNFQMKCYNRLGHNIKEGSCVIIVSHNEHHIARLTSKCVYLRDGCIQQSGQTAEVLRAYENDAIESEANKQKSVANTGNSKPNRGPCSDLSISLLLETSSSLKFSISSSALGRYASQSHAIIWFEFLIRDLDGRPLTYWHDYLDIDTDRPFHIHLELPNLYLNKSRYTASCAIWNKDKTHIYTSTMEAFSAYFSDPLNIADFRVPAVVQILSES